MIERRKVCNCISSETTHTFRERTKQCPNKEGVHVHQRVEHCNSDRETIETVYYGPFPIEYHTLVIDNPAQEGISEYLREEESRTQEHLGTRGIEHMGEMIE